MKSIISGLLAVTVTISIMPTQVYAQSCGGGHGPCAPTTPQVSDPYPPSPTLPESTTDTSVFIQTGPPIEVFPPPTSDPVTPLVPDAPVVNNGNGSTFMNVDDPLPVTVEDTTDETNTANDSPAPVVVFDDVVVSTETVNYGGNKPKPSGPIVIEVPDNPVIAVGPEGEDAMLVALGLGTSDGNVYDELLAAARPILGDDATPEELADFFNGIHAGNEGNQQLFITSLMAHIMSLVEKQEAGTALTPSEQGLLSYIADGIQQVQQESAQTQLDHWNNYVDQYNENVTQFTGLYFGSLPSLNNYEPPNPFPMLNSSGSQAISNLEGTINSLSNAPEGTTAADYGIATGVGLGAGLIGGVVGLAASVAATAAISGMGAGGLAGAWAGAATGGGIAVAILIAGGALHTMNVIEASDFDSALNQAVEDANNPPDLVGMSNNTFLLEEGGSQEGSELGIYLSVLLSGLPAQNQGSQYLGNPTPQVVNGQTVTNSVVAQPGQ